MNNSFEVVFEKVPPQKIGELVSELLSHAGEIECIEFSEENAGEDSHAFTQMSSLTSYRPGRT